MINFQEISQLSLYILADVSNIFPQMGKLVRSPTKNRYTLPIVKIWITEQIGSSVLITVIPILPCILLLKLERTIINWISLH